MPVTKRHDGHHPNTHKRDKFLTNYPIKNDFYWTILMIFLKGGGVVPLTSFGDIIMANLTQVLPLSLVSFPRPVMDTQTGEAGQMALLESDDGLEQVVRAEEQALQNDVLNDGLREGDVYEPANAVTERVVAPRSDGALRYFAHSGARPVRPEVSPDEADSDLAVSAQDTQAVVALQRQMAAELIVATLLALTGKDASAEQKQKYVASLTALFGKLSAEEFLTTEGQILQIAKAILAFTNNTLPKEMAVQFAGEIAKLIQSGVPLDKAKEAIVGLVKGLRSKAVDEDASTYEEIMKSVKETKIIEVKSRDKASLINLAPNVSVAVERNPEQLLCDVLLSVVINETTEKAARDVLESGVAVLYQESILNGAFKALREEGFPMLVGIRIFFDVGHTRTPEGKPAEDGDQVAIDVVHEGTLFRFLVPFTPRRNAGYLTSRGK